LGGLVKCIERVAVAALGRPSESLGSALVVVVVVVGGCGADVLGAGTEGRQSGRQVAQQRDPK
jgi:hypothetical protein